MACPGRLEDLVKQGHCRLDQVQITVLDEADHMADLGFLPGVTRLLAQTPKDGQRMFFSATLDSGVDGLVRKFLSRPAIHQADSAEAPVARWSTTSCTSAPAPAPRCSSTWPPRPAVR